MTAVTWTARECELLGVTLQLLQQHGYERLTVDEVAATARASKATMYRRWPTKADLVYAAVLEGISQQAVTPDTGNLRDDLVEIGEVVSRQAKEHTATMRAVLAENSRDAELGDVVRQRFFGQRKKELAAVLQRAVDRGEIEAEAVHDELWDLMPGYLVYRAVVQDRPPTRRTVTALVDEVIMPSLTRRT
jgi:AcrR family transcriptional regulator